MENTEEKVRINYIPPNFDDDFSVGNFSFDIRYLAETAVLAVIGLLVAHLIVSLLANTIFELDMSSAVITYIICLIAFGGIGMKGIAGDPVYVFLFNLIKFQKKKRIAFYNPRVKTEKKFVLIEDEQNEVETNIVREKVLGMVESVKTSLTDKSLEKIEQMEREQEESYSNLFFEDDIGVVEKPTEYLTSAEKKAAAKAEREAERERQKENRLKEKEERLMRKQMKAERKSQRRKR